MAAEGAARTLLTAGHEQYRCGRGGPATFEDTGLWAGIARLQQLSVTLLDEYRSYSMWPKASIRTGKLGRDAQVLVRLVTSLRETMPDRAYLPDPPRGRRRAEKNSVPFSSFPLLVVPSRRFDHRVAFLIPVADKGG